MGYIFPLISSNVSALWVNLWTAFYRKKSQCCSIQCWWFHSWWVVERCFPVSLCLMWDKIFSIGFKSGLWDLSLMDFLSSHVLVVFAVWVGALSGWKTTSDCSTLENNFSIVGSTSFCNVILYSKALIDFSQWSCSPVIAAEKAPHTMTPLPPCLTVVEMHSLLYFSPDLQTHLSTEILIHHSTQLCWRQILMYRSCIFSYLLKRNIYVQWEQ